MTADDARFEDGGAKPLRLQALTPEDLGVISALTQDSVLPASEMTWDRGARRFALLINRMRWEDLPKGGASDEVSRVRSVLTFDNVAGVQTQGVDRRDADQILSVLSLAMDEDATTDRVIVTLAGDGAIAVTMTALDVSLRDVTRPYRAVSGKVPHHPD
ncbi:DUF2948 family protein [Oceaniglobus indicus]|uniref:DUF2948 family protein n=1 Tax=Oceaniglobus indicus TaxID=2047749 RepID=UPI000C19EC7B|nr:DUF2948 family protein [Oceaniglobus indicus]